MKIKQRIISAILAAAASFSLMSTVSFADNKSYCDVNGDGYVNANDSLFILREALFNDKPDLKLDVNGDGYINAKDALYVLKIFLEIIDPEPIPPAESILDDYSKKWCYSLLTDNQKAAYKTIVEGIMNCDAKIDVPDFKISTADYNTVFNAILADNPHIISTRGAGGMMSEGNKLSYINYTYKLTAAQCSEIMKTVETNTASVIAEAKTLRSDYNRIKLFHDWIINRTDYVDNGQEYAWRLDGPIIYAKSVCEGYSKAFSYLCQSVGIECLCVSGTGYSSIGSGPHMWNMVKVNGSWYHIDLTWDDPVRTDGKQAPRYDYFLISEAKIKEDHAVDNTFKIPTAPSSYAA